MWFRSGEKGNETGKGDSCGCGDHPCYRFLRCGLIWFSMVSAAISTDGVVLLPEQQDSGRKSPIPPASCARRRHGKAGWYYRVGRCLGFRFFYEVFLMAGRFRPSAKDPGSHEQDGLTFVLDAQPGSIWVLQRPEVFNDCGVMTR